MLQRGKSIGVGTTLKFGVRWLFWSWLGNYHLTFFLKDRKKDLIDRISAIKNLTKIYITTIISSV